MRISVILCFILSIPACVLFQSREATAIERILAADRALFEAAAAEARTRDGDPIDYYVRGLNSISLEGAPPDFRSAWINHVSAWEDVQRQIDSAGVRRQENIVSGILSVLRRNPIIFITSIYGLLTEQEINTSRAHASWCRVSELAKVYGARLPGTSPTVAGNFKVNPPEEPECL